MGSAAGAGGDGEWKGVAIGVVWWSPRGPVDCSRRGVLALRRGSLGAERVAMVWSWLSRRANRLLKDVVKDAGKWLKRSCSIGPLIVVVGGAGVKAVVGLGREGPSSGIPIGVSSGWERVMLPLC